MSKRRLLMIVGLLLGAVLTLLFGFLYTHSETKEPLQPVSSVKDAYLECTEHTSEERIATCLDELASTVYGVYPTEEIAAVLDSLTYRQKDHWCHEIMHYMGWEAYTEEKDIAKAFLNSSELCDSGMYHGVMEEFMRREGLSSRIEELVRTVCTDSLSGRPDVSDGLLALCYHGLGHGLMYITTSDIQKSLDYCDALEDSTGAGSCYGGVFMEYNISKELGPLSNERDLTDFSYCEDLKEKHRTTCYVRQGLNHLAATGDVQKSMELCLQVPSERQSLCFEGVGANNPAPSKTHDTAAKDCHGALTVSEDAYAACIKGSLGFVMQLEWGDTEAANLFCSVIEDPFKEYCYFEVGKASQPWITETETSEKKCSVLPGKEAQDACLWGTLGKVFSDL